MSPTVKILIIAAAAGAGFFVLKKGGVIPAAQVKSPPSNNVPGDMWAQLLGKGWTDLLSGSTAVDKNSAGQVTTQDGKPIGTGDPALNYFQASNATWGI